MKKFLWIISSLLMLGLAVIIAPFFIPAETYKSQIVSQFKTATGRTLTIQGPIQFSLLPNVSIKVEDATISNPDGFSSKYFASFKTLALDVALAPLWNKKLEVQGVTLIEPMINLEKIGDRVNWDFSQTEKEKTASDSSRKSDDNVLPAWISLQKIKIQHGVLSYKATGEKPIDIKALDVAMDWKAVSEPVKIHAEFEWKGKPVKADTVIKDVEALLAGKNSFLDIDVELPASTLKYVGALDTKDSVGLDGNVSFKTSDLPALQKWLAGTAPNPRSPKELLYTSNIKIKNSLAKLSDLKLEADNLKMSGTLAVNYGDAVPAISGNVKLPVIDTKRFSSEPSAHANVPGNPAKAPVWSTELIDFSSLRKVNADLDVTLDGLIADKISLENVRADVKLSKGVLNLACAPTRFFGGMLSGAAKLDAAGGVGASFTLSDINSKLLFGAFADTDRISGKLNMTTSVNGRGKSERDIVNSLSGNGKINLTNGSFKGINLAAMVRNAKTAFLNTKSGSEKTDFSEMGGTYTITNGIINNTDLVLKAPLLRLAGEGKVNLPARTLAYRVTPKIVNTLEGEGGIDDAAGIEVPVIIEGPWSNLSFRPDLAAMLKDPKKLEQNIKALRDNAKEQIKDIKNQIKDIKNIKNDPAALQNILGGVLGVPAKQTTPASESGASPATPPAASAPEPQADKPVSPPASSPPPAEKSDKEKAMDALGGMLNGR